jgi:hypothetical protein
MISCHDQRTYRLGLLAVRRGLGSGGSMTPRMPGPHVSDTLAADLVRSKPPEARPS